MHNFKAYVGVVIAMLVWSSSFVLTKVGLETFPPIMLVTIRMVLAAFLLFLLGYGTGALKKIDNKRDLLLFMGAGFVQPFAYFVSEAYGLTQVSPTVASVILSTIPIFTPLIALVLIRERVTLLNFVGLVISLLGVMMIIVNKGESLEISFVGVLCLFVSVLAGCTYAVLLRKVPSDYSNVCTVFYVHFFSLIYFLPTFFVVDVLNAPEGVNVFDVDLGNVVTVKSLLSILVLAVFASVMSYVFYSKAVRDIGATKVNAFCNIMPAATALLMYFAFGEHLSYVKWLGIAVVMAGLFISQVKFRGDEN